MTVRIGLGPSAWDLTRVGPDFVWRFIDAAEEQGWDSLWFSDRVIGPRFSLEPMALMAAVAGRTRRLKFGTSVLAQAVRHPLVTAKEIATIDYISGGRVLPVFGLGGEDPLEYEACGVEKRERAARVDEAVPLIRRLWLEESVTHEGRFYPMRNVGINPRPFQQPPPLWIGGRSRAALERAGRIGSGWLASSVTPEEVARGIPVIQESAAAAGKRIEDDHFGVLLSFKVTGDGAAGSIDLSPYMAAPRPDVPAEAYTAIGSVEHIIGRIREYIDAGAEKLVMRPACPPHKALEHMARFAQRILPVFHTWE